MTPPRIVVSAGFPCYGDYMGLAYARPLEAVGALPLQLPYLEDVEPILDLADGVLLGFGADIEPARYGGEPHPKDFPLFLADWSKPASVRVVAPAS